MIIAWLPWILLFLVPFALLFKVITGIPFIIWYSVFVGIGIYFGIKKNKELIDKNKDIK
jgi:multidrug transporter EmrE-like cation transporter